MKSPIWAICSISALCIGLGYLSRGLFEDEAIQREESKETSAQGSSLIRKENGPLLKNEISSEVNLLLRSQRDTHIGKKGNLDYRLIEDDPESAFAWLLNKKNNLGEERYESYLQNILFSWAMKDPEAAAVHMGEINSVIGKEMFVSGLATGWANQGVHEAFDWLQSPSTADYSASMVDQCYKIIMTKYAEEDFIAAAEIIGKLGSEELQIELLSSVLEPYAEQDYSKAISWALDLQNDNARNIAFSRLMSEAQERGGPDLLGTVLDNQSKLTSHALATAFNLLSEKDQLVAAVNLSNVTPDAQATVTKSFANTWLKNDENAAMNWFKEQASGAILDAGAEAIADHMTKDDPLVAIEWAKAISDPSSQSSLILRIAHNSGVDHLEAIGQTIGTLSLPQAEREELREMINRRLASATAPLIIPQ